MIDMHCHILHGMDDGSGSLEESVELCRLAAANSIRTVVLTPHLPNPSQIEEFLHRRERRMEELKRAIDRQGVELELLPGAEVFVDDDVFFAPNLDGATLNGSRYILIEFTFRGLNTMRLVKYVNEFFARGYVPIIAHPERYFYTQENYDIINHLGDLGVLFQLNGTSLVGTNGMEAKELGFAMANSGMASFIGSDAHSLHRRPNDLLAMMDHFPRAIPFDVYDRMLNANPEKIINNEDFDRGPFVPIYRKRFL